MTVTVGIDLGAHVLHVGVVRDRDEVIGSIHLFIEKEHLPSQVAGCIDKLQQYLSSYYPDRVVVERPFIIPGHGFAALHMVEMFTICKLVAYRINAEFVPVSPKQWRLRVFANGNANKKDAFAQCKVLGFEPDDHNAAESVSIALYE